MKKSLILVVAALVCVTGCGNKSSNKVVCTSEHTEAGIKMKAVVTASFKDDKVNDVSAYIDFDDKDSAKQYCTLLEFANAYAESEDEKIKFECKDTKIEITDYASMMSDNDENVIGLTKDAFIELAEAEEFTCK